MTCREHIENAIARYGESQLILSGNLYKQLLCEKITEGAYQKALERLCQQGRLERLSKGVYCKPKKSKYGVILPSEKDIVRAFTSENSGTVVGYALYNSLQLTTQVGKSIEVFSSKLDQQAKTIGNVRVKRYALDYSPEVTHTIRMLEVLRNFHEIQELNYSQFLQLCKRFAGEYREDVFEAVAEEISYSKSTISFLREVLNYYGVPNTLGRRLSSLSTYNHPKMEVIYGSAHLPA